MTILGYPVGKLAGFGFVGYRRPTSLLRQGSRFFLDEVLRMLFASRTLSPNTADSNIGHMEDNMIGTTPRRRCFFAAISSASFLLFAILIAAPPGFSHGGKGHATDVFTTLQALQKATELYNQLLWSGKLPGIWETDLARVEISNRNKGRRQEIVVSFQRHTGEPKTVYIFFSADGRYAGSNFTGQ
jgi:hypothetical protein